MILFVFTGTAPPIMLLVLAVTLYLTVIELRPIEDLAFLYKAWWFLFVLLAHVPGYLILRLWVLWRRNRSEPNQPPPTPGSRGRRGGGRA